MQKYGILIFTSIILGIFTKANAQIISIDKIDTSGYKKDAKFDLVFGSGLEVDKQKTTIYDATNTLDATLQKEKELLILSSSFRFTYNGPDDILNIGFVHLRFRHNYKNKLHPESYLQYQWDNKRGIENRSVGGANIRWNNYLHPRYNLVLATGLMYEQERWNYTAVPDSINIPKDSRAIEIQYIKSNSYIKFEIKTSENSDLFFTTFLQTRPDHYFIYPRIANVLKWNVNITKHVGIEFNFNSIYDTQPVVPISKFYFSFSESITFKI